MSVNPAPIREPINGLVSQAWGRFFESIYKSLSGILPLTGADNGNTSITLTYGSAMTQRFNTPLTAARTVTLPTNKVFNGMKFRVVREAGATGAFNLAVGGIKTLSAAGSWVDVEHDGVAWRVTGAGSL